MRKFLFLILTFPLLAQTPTERVGQINTGCLDVGSTDTYACNLPLPAPVAYVTGAIYSFRANTANTGAASINFNSLGAKTIVKVAGGITTALADNDIRAGQVVVLSYDGTNMEMQSTLGNAGGGGGTPSSPDTSLQYNNGGSFGGASGTSWTDATRNLNILDANNNHMFIFTTDPTGDPYCNAVFNIGCDSVRPPSVGTTPGTGSGVIELDGVPGGNTSIVTTGVGGRGGQTILWSGGGGVASAAATASTGGDGGPLHINGGPGGAANDAANLGINVGGHGADLTFAAGIGGAASNGSSNTGGRGGNITIQPGTGGNGSTVNGAFGKIILPTLAGGGAQFVTVDNSGNVGAAGLAGSLGACQVYATSNTFGGDAAFCLDNFTALSTPSAPVITHAGTAGISTWGYKVTALNVIGETVYSAEGTTTTGNATLSMSNYTIITTPAVANSTSCNVSRSTAAMSPATTGFIGNVACGAALNDTGLSVIAGLLPNPQDLSGLTTGGFQSHLRLNNSDEGPSLYVGPGQYGLDPNIAIWLQVAPQEIIISDGSNGKDVGLWVTSVGTAAGQNVWGGFFLSMNDGAAGWSIGAEFDAFGNLDDNKVIANYAYTNVLNGHTGVDSYNYYATTDGGAVTTVAYYATDFSGSATNPYYLWFDSRGVLRTKEDSSFDGVGQAITALYNPQFTKYTPGTPNYERLIEGGWNGNVSEVGNYAGGTGTARKLRMLGNGIDFGTASNIAATTFAGAGTDDGVYNGTYTGSTLTYCAIIDATGTPDTFKWGTNGGCDNGATGVAITGANQALSSGVVIKFATTTGHTLTDKWSVVATGAATHMTFDNTTLTMPTVNIQNSSFTFNSLTCTVVAGAIACS